MIGHSSCIRSDEESQHDWTMSYSGPLMINYLEIVHMIGFLDALASQQEFLVPDSLKS